VQKTSGFEGWLIQVAVDSIFIRGGLSQNTDARSGEKLGATSHDAMKDT